MASYLAGIRTVLRECGLDMGTGANLTAVLVIVWVWVYSTLSDLECTYRHLITSDLLSWAAHACLANH